jgi:glycosyltransferase involved in cell wall biosynthesis
VRIVFLTHNFPRWPGDVSGAFLASLGSALVDRGHEVRVIAPANEGNTGRIKFDGMSVRRVRYASPERETIAYRGTMTSAVRTVRGLRTFVGLLKAMRSAAREEMATGDVLHAHWWVPGGMAAPPESRYVLTIHGTDAALLTQSMVARALARPVIHRAKVVTTVSSFLAGIIKTRGGREILPHKIQPMPAATPSLHPAPQSGTGLVVVSRLTGQKRVDLAIEAAGVLRDQGRGLPLLVVGDGPEREHLERKARTLALEDFVRFEGSVSPEQIGGLLSDRAVMLFPARAEGFGLVAAEAFMAGVSVVACSDGGGVLDVVPNAGGGRIVEPEPQALAQAALELIDRPNRLAEASELGEEWRRRLMPSVVAAQCEEWYREALRVA